jgi:hypothetical protein
VISLLVSRMQGIAAHREVQGGNGGTMGYSDGDGVSERRFDGRDVERTTEDCRPAPAAAAAATTTLRLAATTANTQQGRSKARDESEKV